MKKTKTEQMADKIYACITEINPYERKRLFSNEEMIPVAKKYGVSLKVIDAVLNTKATLEHKMSVD